MANHQRSVEKEAYWRGQVDRQVADNADSQRCEIGAHELALLLAGIDLASVRRRKRFERPSAAAASSVAEPSASPA